MPTKVGVFGATGNQGKWVCTALERRGTYQVVAFTRSPQSPAADALRARGFEVRRADLLMPPSDIAKAIADCPVVYAMTQPWNVSATHADPDSERRQGENLIAACKLAGVQHLIYSSVINKDRLRSPASSIPHVQHKFATVDRALEQGVPISVIAPTQFMDNWLMPFMKICDGHLDGFVTPTAKVMYVSCRDIGELVAKSIERGPPSHAESEGLDKPARYVPAFTSFISTADLASIFARTRNSPRKWTASAPPFFLLKLFAPEYALMRQFFEESGLPPTCDRPETTEQMRECRAILDGDVWEFERWIKEVGLDKVPLPPAPMSTAKKAAIAGAVTVAAAGVAVAVYVAKHKKE